MYRLIDWAAIAGRRALLGEVYPQIRAIACKYENKHFTLRYYLEREPEDYDYKSIETVYKKLYKQIESEEIIETYTLECVFSDIDILQRDFDSLHGFLYARREWIDIP